MFRGKPRDAGFRLRSMMFTQSWTKLDGVWKMAAWQLSPIIGYGHQRKHEDKIMTKDPRILVDHANIDDLKATFMDVFSGPFDYEKIADFIADNALVVSHDVPFPFDKTGYVDHMQFHGELWESREFKPEAVEVRVYGKTGVISCYFNERGKPKDAGFRQRPGYMTVTCHLTDNGWQAIGLHTASLLSQILAASPS